MLQTLGLYRGQEWTGSRITDHLIMKRVVTILLVALIVLCTSVLCIGWILGRPVQTKIGNPPRDLNAESVEFPSDSGTIVKGWWCQIEQSQHVILLLPGIRANRLSMLDRARFLRRAGYSTLLIDFQATGETKGEHITFGWKESQTSSLRLNSFTAFDLQIALALSEARWAVRLHCSLPLR